jgi:hypothetical protein
MHEWTTCHHFPAERGSPHARGRLVLADAVSIANVDASEQGLRLAQGHMSLCLRKTLPIH